MYLKAVMYTVLSAPGLAVSLNKSKSSDVSSVLSGTHLQPGR
jgi:hypothetical protein